MFSAPNSSKVTAACMLLMMMMMMVVMEAAVVPKAGVQSKHSAKTHRKSPGAAAVETVSLRLDANALAASRHVRPLHNASTSPWTYSLSHDDSLFPQTLSEARCLLHGCLDSDGQEDLNLESRPIMHQVLLLRLVKPEGGEASHYRLESRLVAVGCTCVRPAVQQQQ